MNQRINGQMITLARESRGLTQRALAEHLEVTQATISKYESGAADVPSDHLLAVAELLERPLSFFAWNERIYGASCLHHRRAARIPLRELKQIHAQVNVLRIQAERLLRHTSVKSAYSFHRLDMQKLGGAREVARRLRKLWQMPTGPVKSITDSIEGAGGIVFRCAFGTARIDGISQWPLDCPELPPVFFVSDRAPGDRQRWTLAHEIGHVLMHHLPTDDPEVEANHFAAEFLMPSDEILPELRNLTLQKAAALKSYWRVSMQAIIRWAHFLGKITRNQYEYLFKQMGYLGYRMCEPVPLPAEQPALIHEMVKVHRKASGRAVRELSEELGLLEADFQSQYLNGHLGLRLVS